MVTRIDDNGKTFTDRVRKERIAAIVQTATHQVRGFVFCDAELRLKDELNATQDQFIAVADAEVLAPDGQVIRRTPFLTINKQHIIWLMPLEEGATKAQTREIL
jgi:hypothetical protein